MRRVRSDLARRLSWVCAVFVSLYTAGAAGIAHAQVQTGDFSFSVEAPVASVCVSHSVTPLPGVPPCDGAALEAAHRAASSADGTDWELLVHLALRTESGDDTTLIILRDSGPAVVSIEEIRAVSNRAAEGMSVPLGTSMEASSPEIMRFGGVDVFRFEATPRSLDGGAPCRAIITYGFAADGGMVLASLAASCAALPRIRPFAEQIVQGVHLPPKRVPHFGEPSRPALEEVDAVGARAYRVGLLAGSVLGALMGIGWLLSRRSKAR